MEEVQGSFKAALFLSHFAYLRVVKDLEGPREGAGGDLCVLEVDSGLWCGS